MLKCVRACCHCYACRSYAEDCPKTPYAPVPQAPYGTPHAFHGGFSMPPPELEHTHDVCVRVCLCLSF